MIGNDGMDDVTILVNSSPDKLMGSNLSFTNGFPAVSSAVLCAKASMLLQVGICFVLGLWKKVEIQIYAIRLGKLCTMCLICNFNN